MKWTDQSPDNSPVRLSHNGEPAGSRTLCDTDSGQASIITSATVHQQVLAHLRTHSVEQGGLLIGVPYRFADSLRDGDTPDLVSVVAAVPATDTTGTGYSLRMEASVWADASAQMQSMKAGDDTPGLRIVGWYHSHPGLGAFFSSTDRQTQKAFFSHAYSVGWVIDPQDDTHAAFIGRDSQPCRFIVASHDTVMTPDLNSPS